MALLIAVLTFVVVALMLIGVFMFARAGRQQSVIRARLDALDKAQRRGHVSLETQLIRDELLSDVPAINRLLLRWAWPRDLRQFLSQAGLRIKPGRLLLFSAVLGLAAFIAVKQIYLNPFAALLSGVFAATLPALWVIWKRRRRLRAFEKNFPEAIDLLARAVRAGHAFTTGMEMIATELPQPVSGEFRITFEEQNFGLPLKEALLNLSERIPLIDVRFFVTALMIQRETGGNLAEILDNLARVIRDRFRIYGEVRIRTAQGRLTAGILIALPPMMVVAMRFLNPDYIKVLFEDPWGPPVLAAAALMQVLGSMMLWKIVHIEV